MNTIDGDLEALFNRLVDGIASEADEKQLGELLRSRPEVRRAYREFMSLHAALHWDFVAALSPEVAGKNSLKSPPAVSFPASPMGWMLAFAAGTIIASVVAIFWPRTNVDRAPNEIVATHQPRETTNPAPKTDVIAALLVDQVGAEFAEGRAPDGIRIGPGEYELLKGIVHLRFAQGADVVIASPARLDVRDAQHTRLVYGNVRVTAPSTARGFTIATDAADYVDLGTEFGLRVDHRNGASDLYVFDGQVNVADPRTGKVLSEVMEGESSRYVDGAAETVPEIDEQAFPTPGAIGFQRWQQYEQEMRADNRLLAFYPFRRTSDESALVNSRTETEMPAGRIEGARWTTGRWPGKEALLFDRDTDFVQLNIPGEHDELTIAVWLKLDRLDFVFNAILNSDGYDLGHVHLQLTRQGHPRGGVAVAGQYEDRLVGSPVPLGQWTHVASVLSRETRSHRVYVNGILALERHWRTDQVLHPGSCRLGNWLALEGDQVTTRALRGRVDELAIWNRNLSVDEIKKLFEVGRPGMLGSDK
ncbi:FecR protein [Anatilimnocola aggregata]|uniref:FecR protein n=1 Tax=Anatilimnocola aggregata TaxID=2528021 RepID=A0A517Y8M2_9BACT|nr:LamG-like jellyroll fold domain-containing protein [Anatilimnocola aggregata]QDU26598.1 FecR protein [Anatilimnocola aggregata]